AAERTPVGRWAGRRKPAAGRSVNGTAKARPLGRRGQTHGRSGLAAQLVPIAARNNLQTGPARKYANFAFSRRLRRRVDGEGLHVVARVAVRAELGDEGRPRLTPAEEDERVASRLADVAIVGPVAHEGVRGRF